MATQTPSCTMIYQIRLMEASEALPLANKEYFSNEANEWYKLQYYLAHNIDPSHATYEQLHSLLSSTFTHARRRENLFPLVERHPDLSLRCIFSGTTLSDHTGKMLEKANEEHSFPQSYQRGTKMHTGRDMHAIFAASTSANGSRGNTPFGNKGKKLEQGPNGTTYSHQGRKYFQPKINKGTLARATLYILVCYQGCAHPEYLPKESLEWLVGAAQEEVNLWEKHRNQELFLLQGTRNPFIDYPQLAQRIDFSKGWQENPK